jgi:endoglucanase
MKQFPPISFLFLLILSACAPARTTPIISTHIPFIEESPMSPTAQPESTPTLSRGVNMGNMLEAPNEGDWGLYVQEEYFDAIKEAGFDFIRLPIRWNTHAEESAPYTIDPAFFTRVDEIVSWAMERDLSIIVDFHHYEEIMWDPASHKDGFIGIWKQVAEHYKDYPSNVLFELLNEPNDQLNAVLWNEYLRDALAVVRESNPTRDVVIGPVNWNAYDWISTLNVPNDAHFIVTFHYYLPFEFTHQGADWVGEESNKWLGTTWDGTDENKGEITRNFDSVAEWAKQKNIRILLGEFGAYSKADMDSRARWTGFVAREAERHGFAWAYWEFGSGFGAYDPDAKVWRQELLKALIP